MEYLLNIVKKFKNSEKQVIYNIEKWITQSLFVHNSAYSDDKNLAKRTTLDKALKKQLRAYAIARNPYHNSYQKPIGTI